MWLYFISLSFLLLSGSDIMVVLGVSCLISTQVHSNLQDFYNQNVY